MPGTVAPCAATLLSRAGAKGDGAPAGLACVSSELRLSTTSMTPASAEGALVATAAAKAPPKAVAAAPAAAAAASACLEREVTESAGFGSWDCVVRVGVTAAPPTSGDRCSRFRISERRMARRALWKRKQLQTKQR